MLLIPEKSLATVSSSTPSALHNRSDVSDALHL